MKNKFYLFLFLYLISQNYKSQNIGINATGANADPSAALDVVSTNKGLLIPRVALTSLNSALPIVSPLTSLMVYNTATAGAIPNNVVPGYYFWDGTKWVSLSGAISGGLNWNILGNAGTNSTNNFIGTIDGQDLVFRTNNTEKMRLTTNGAFGNNSVNIIGSDGQGLNAQSLSWQTAANGYAAAIINSGSNPTANGLAVKTIDNSGNTSILDLSTGTQTSTGLPIMSVRANGKVGIGTNVPSNILHIKTATSPDAIAIENTTNNWLRFAINTGNGSYNGLTLGGDRVITWGDLAVNSATSGLTIGPWNSNKRGMRIDSAGNVGFNTSATSYAPVVISSTASAGNQDALVLTNPQLYGALPSNLSSVSINFTKGNYNYNTPLARISSGNMTSATSCQGWLSFSVRNGCVPVDGTTEAMRIIDIGNVGINTTNPSNKLEIKATNPNESGLRFTNMTFATPPTTANGKALSVDVNGDVILVPSAATSGADWSLTGNAGTTAGTNFLGTTDGQDLVFKTSNAEQMRILTNGKVGIATGGVFANPEKLVVNGDLSLAQYITFQDHSSFVYSIGTISNYTMPNYGLAYPGTNTAAEGWLSGYAAIRMFTFGGERMVIDNIGRVGIGTSNPSSLLHLNSANTTALTIEGNATGYNNAELILKANNGTNHRGLGVIMNDNGTSTTWFAGRPYYSGNTNGSDQYQINRTTVASISEASAIFDGSSNPTLTRNFFTINNTGNVGIGVISPIAKLEVGGNSLIGGSTIAGANASQLHISSGNSTSDSRVRFGYWNGAINTGIYDVGYKNNGNFGIMNVSSGIEDPLRSLYLTNNGHFGIAVANPITMLHVAGVHVGSATGTGASSDGPTQAIIPSGAGGSLRYNDWPATWAGGISTWDIDGASTFFSQYFTRSDKKLKRDITDMNDELLDRVLKLHPVTYYLKEQTPETEGLQYGFIAQEVRELFPSIVTKSNSDDTGVIGMNYQALIAPTVYLVQKQNKEITTLKSLLEMQQKQIEELTKKIDKLSEK